MLNLENFEEQISPLILQRGRDYYNDGLVTDLEEISDNVWSAEVSGSEDYLVEVSLSGKNEINDFSCGCPYDGPVCKHVAAVCFAIREKKANVSKTKSPAKQKKNAFEDLLNAVTLEEYRDFIRKAASGDKDFKTKFELFFSEKMDSPDVEKKYSGLIQKIIRNHSDRGYIDYRSSRQLASEMDHLFAQGQEMIVRSNFRDAFSLSKAALKALIEVIQCCDDSSGSIGGSICDAISLLSDIACSDNAAPDLKQAIFNFLQSELAQDQYFDYGDFGYELFSVYHSLAVLLGQSTAFINFIDNQCGKLTGEYDDFQREFYQKEKINFYVEKGWAKEAEVLIRQNLDIVEVRRAEVDKAFNRKDYAAAKQLIADGIQIAEDKKRPGTVDQWKQVLLRIAAAENDIKTIRRLSQYFMFGQGFSKEYYQQWKQTHSAAEQKDAVERLIVDRIDEANQEHSKYGKSFFGKSQPPYLRYVGALYVEEQMWDRLLEALQVENNFYSSI